MLQKNNEWNKNGMGKGHGAFFLSLNRGRHIIFHAGIIVCLFSHRAHRPCTAVTQSICVALLQCMQNITKVDQSTIDENACQVISEFLTFLNKLIFEFSSNPVLKVAMMCSRLCLHRVLLINKFEKWLGKIYLS